MGIVRRVRALFAAGLLVFLGCPLPSNVLYRCESNGSCTQPGRVCALDGFCREPVDAGPFDAGLCVPHDRTAACVSVECGFVSDGCEAELDCERPCPAPQECGTAQPNRCALPSLCSGENWCWENPLPQGLTLNASTRIDARHTWFVGENRVIVFFDGERSRLQDAPAPPGVELLGIHGTASNDVFAVGNSGVTLHFDGTRWEREGTLSGFNNQLRTVWSFGDGGAMAAGPGGRLLTRAALVDPFSRWTLEPFPSTEEISEVFADSAGDAYAVTRRNELFIRPAGTGTWTRLDTVPLNETLCAIARSDGLTFGGTNPNRANVMHRHFDGGWRQLTDAGFATSGFSRGDGGVFVLGTGSEFAWLDDADQFTRFQVQPGTWNTGVALPGPKLLLAGLGGSTAEAELDGGLTWRSTPRVTRGLSLNAVCGYAPGAMFAVGGTDTNAGPVRWLERQLTTSGAQWVAQELSLGNTTQLLACFAEGPDRVWLTGDDSKFVHQSAGAPTSGDFGGSVAGRYSGAWGSADAGYFFARRQSSELTTSADGVSGFATLNVSAPSSVLSVWGLNRDDMLVAGLNGSISHFDGTSWISASGIAQTEFASVHGARLADGGQRYVAAGSAGVLYSLEGDAGIVTQLSPAVDFRAAWVSRRGTAWAGGSAADGGAFVMRGGAAWSVLPLTSPRPVTGVFGLDLPDGGVELWVSGPLGMVLRRLE